MKRKPINKIETASLEFNFLKDANALQANEFEGMASVFDTPIMAWTPTVIEKGAFKKTLKEKFANRGVLDRVKILLNHNPDIAIGRPTLLEETSDGLLMRGRISETAAGKDALTLMRDGVMDSLSIGFDPIKFNYQEHEDKQLWRHIQEIRLWEVSVVTMPANPAALITDINSLDEESLDTIFESLAALPLGKIAEAHVGKVLSSKNKKLISDAVAALQALIAAAEPPEKKDDQALTGNIEQANLRDLHDLQLWLLQ